MTPLGTHALKLAQRGLRVFPCVERGKTPAIKDNLKVATVDGTVIGVWWKGHDFNIGVATGPGSRVWCLDVDDVEGERTLRRLEALHGALPATVESITGTGRHLWFRWPAGEAIRNSQLREDLPGVDVRASGGYAALDPSFRASLLLVRRFGHRIRASAAMAPRSRHGPSQARLRQPWRVRRRRADCNASGRVAQLRRQRLRGLASRPCDRAPRRPVTAQVSRPVRHRQPMPVV